MFHPFEQYISFWGGDIYASSSVDQNGLPVNLLFRPKIPVFFLSRKGENFLSSLFCLSFFLSFSSLFFSLLSLFSSSCQENGNPKGRGTNIKKQKE